MSLVVHSNRAADPWQHLIQARSYRLIGETALGEAELAAAELAAVDNDDAQLAHQRLVDDWDDIERSVLEQELTGELDALNVVRGLIGNAPADVRHRRTMAACLHSIGDIQIGLEEYEAAEESLREALDIRRLLLDERPDDSQALFDIVAVEYSMGRWDWVQGNYPEAHQLWQTCLTGLLQLAETNRENGDLQKELSIQERTICQHHGRIGLWSYVQEYAARCVEFDSVWSAADIPELVSEGELSAIVLGGSDEELAGNYFRQLADSLQNAEYEWTFDLIHLVRVIAAIGKTDLLSDELLLHYRSKLEESPEQEWIAVGMAMVHYRLEQYSEAQSAIESFRGSHTPQLAFLDAAIASELENKELAQQRWSEGDSRYRQICRDALVRDVTDNNNGVFGQYFWQYAFDQAIRSLALEAMSEELVTGDPWHHLIQARGYRLIGETEQAEAELAAAGAAAGDNPDVWLARAELFERWDDIERAEADWQRAVELAGDDPMPWIHRGRWYAMQGEQEKADADFAHAASLTPNELNRFLEAGWWVVGPYPATVDEFCPPELDPRFVTAGVHDRSADRPVGRTGCLAIDPPRATWGSSTSITSPTGMTQPPTMHSHMSTRPTNAACCCEKTPLGTEMRLWVNGVEISTPRLCRVALTHPRSSCDRDETYSSSNALATDAALRWETDPLIVHSTLLEQGRWSEAAALVRQHNLSSSLSSWGLTGDISTAIACAGDRETYNAIADWLAQRVNTPNWALVGLCQLPNPALEMHADEIIALAESFVQQEPAPN